MKYTASFKIDDSEVPLRLIVDAKDIKDVRKQTKEYAKTTYGMFFIKYKFICAHNELGEMFW